MDQCNRAGGIKGRKIELIMKDDQQNPEMARKAVRELISEGVVAIIGPGTSENGRVRGADRQRGTAWSSLVFGRGHREVDGKGRLLFSSGPPQRVNTRPGWPAF